MRIKDYKRSRFGLNSRLYTNLGVFAIFTLITAVSAYVWSPARESSAYDWTATAGSSVYKASLSGNNAVTLNITPASSQQVFSANDNLSFTSTCPYSSSVTMKLSSTTSALTRTGSDSSSKTIAATTGSSLANNSWGYSINNGTNYYPVPISSASAATIYSASGAVTSAATISVKYGVKVNNTVPGGAYTNTIVYTTAANTNCAKYTLKFNTDGGSAISDVSLTYGQTINLANYTTTKSGYRLTGWIKDSSTTYATNATGVNPNASNALTVTLKAQWQQIDKPFNNITYMQDMTQEICAAETTPTASATTITFEHTTDTSKVPRAVLIDKRDNKKYLVSKLADGNCWMSQNLALNLSTSTALTSTTSDIKSVDSITPSESTKSGSISTSGSDVSSYLPQSGRQYLRGGTSYSSSATGSGDEYLWESAGVYYNNHAARLVSWGTEGAPTTDDICPKNWRLPDSADNGLSYYNLHSKYGMNSGAVVNTSKLVGAPFNYTTRARYINDSSVDIHYLTAEGNDFIVTLSGSNYTSATLPNGFGTVTTNAAINARCVIGGNNYTAKDIFGITTMQEMTPEICENTTTPAPISSTDTVPADDYVTYVSMKDTNLTPRTILKDTRDNKKYLVSKLADGNCWMSQDLQLDLSTSKAFTSSDTNLRTKSSWTPENNTQTATGTAWTNYGTGADTARSYHYASNEAYEKGGNTQSASPTGDGYQYWWEKTGNSYNWYAATAGSGHYDVTGVTIQDSICPKGWTLPEGGMTLTAFKGNIDSYGTKGSFAGLLKNAYNVGTSHPKAMNYPLNFIKPGRYAGSAVASRSFAYYWSNAASAANANQSLQGWLGTEDVEDTNGAIITQSRINGDQTNVKGYGGSIRCIAEGAYTTKKNENRPSGTSSTTQVTTPFGLGFTPGNLTQSGYRFRGWRQELYTAGSTTMTREFGRKQKIGSVYDNSGASLVVVTGGIVKKPTVPLNNVTPELKGIWVPSSEPVTIYDIDYMQDMTSTICNNTETPTASLTTVDWAMNLGVPRTTLIDRRDNKKYLVTKLADGNCWMSQNLELDLSTGTALTNTYTDLNSKTSWTPTANTETAVGTSWNNTDIHSYKQAVVTQYTRAGTTMQRMPTADLTEFDWERTGNYYNFYAATAGSGTGSTANQEVTDSICPKGWKLPTTSSATTVSKDYNNLKSTYSMNGAKSIADPLNFTRSGEHNAAAALANQGSTGYYWSSTLASSSNAYALTVSSDTINARSSQSKKVGLSIRCVAR